VGVGRRFGALAAVALGLTAIDLVQKASAPVYGHPRGLAFVAGAAALAVAIAVLVPRVPSLPLSVAGGVAAAGALGNLVSALAWRGGVPNPIVVGDVAFNIADVCAVSGAAALVLGAALFALTHPALLRDPV
jgi:lipoprotein signal peptidase